MRKWYCLVLLLLTSAETLAELDLADQRHLYQIIDRLLAKPNATTSRLMPYLIDKLDGYPLQNELRYRLLIADKKNLSIEKLRDFQKAYPDEYVDPQLAVNWYRHLHQTEQWEKILSITPALADNTSVCIQLNATLHLQLSDDKTWQQIQSIWLTGNSLPNQCDYPLEQWFIKVPLTFDLIAQRAWLAFEQKNSGLLRHLINLYDGKIVDDNNRASHAQLLSMLLDLTINPANLSNWVNQENSPINQQVITKSFERYIQRLKAEHVDFTDPFALYEQWATKFNLDKTAKDDWKRAFLWKFFDVEQNHFKAWRDQQIKLLKQDDLTERRIREAILYKEPLDVWLALLSEQAQQKQEWQFWQAYAYQQRGQQQKSMMLWQALMEERGFYPMLAAQQLGKTYQPHFAQLPESAIQAKVLTQYQSMLARVHEFIYMQKLSEANRAWRQLLANVDEIDKIILADYARRQDWYDLAVEATIQAKAWDYVEQRLPIAYPLYFDLHIQEKWVPKSFALAIARQESAFRPQVKSHANAMGLMQLLPTTASATANKYQLPYRGEQDLFFPFNNIMLGVQHLEELKERFGENRILIAAAYNAGSSRVINWLERAGGQLNLAEFIATIPFYETRGYVQNVLAYDYYYQMLLNQSLIKFTQTEYDRLY